MYLEEAINGVKKFVQSTINGSVEQNLEQA